MILLAEFVTNVSVATLILKCNLLVLSIFQYTLEGKWISDALFERHVCATMDFQQNNKENAATANQHISHKLSSEFGFLNPNFSSIAVFLF